MWLGLMIVPVGVALVVVLAYLRLSAPLMASTRDAERLRRQGRARAPLARRGGPPIMAVGSLTEMQREVDPYVRDATARRPTGLRVPLLILRPHRGRHSILNSRLPSLWSWVGPVVTFADQNELAAGEGWATPWQGELAVTGNDQQLRERLLFAGCARRAAPFGVASILARGPYWERALGEILSSVRLGLIDLRGSELRNPHAARELSFLLARARLRQVVAVTDSLPRCEDLLRELWRDHSGPGPRYDDVLRVIEVTGDDMRLDPALLTCLLHASATAPGGPLLR